MKSSAMFWTEHACEVTAQEYGKNHLKDLDRTVSGARTELGTVPTLICELGKRDSWNSGWNTQVLLQ